MTYTTDVLYLDGEEVAVPKENGITIGRYKTWSQNSGRTESGKAIGTILYIKYKVEIAWDKLSSEEIKQIDDIVSNKDKPFTKVKFRDINGSLKEITCYFGDSVMGVTRYENGKPIVDGYKLSAIEQ